MGFGWRHGPGPAQRLPAWERGSQSSPQLSPSGLGFPVTKWASELFSLPQSREIGQWHNAPPPFLLTVSVVSTKERGSSLGNPR